MRKVVLALILTAVGLGVLLSVKSRSATAVVSANASVAAPPAPTLTAAPSATSPATTSAPTSTPTSTPTATASATTSSPTAVTSSALKNGTFTGTAVGTRFGDVQVQAVISGGKLTNVIVLQVPDRGGYEEQIVQIAVPELKTEALSAQSSNIDVISGATYTSEGYAESLQSALDQAKS